MSQVIAGYDGGVYVGESLVAKITSWSLDMSADDIDITSFDSGGWRERIQGLREWSGSFEGSFMPNDTQGQAALINAWLNGQKVGLELQVSETVKFSGDAFVTLSIEMPVEEKANFSCDFQGTGSLTVTGIGAGS